MNYVINPKCSIVGPRDYKIEPETIERSVKKSKIIIDQLNNSTINIFKLLGMRNLSALVGEIFTSCLVDEYKDILIKNPHQDGYPDILLLDEIGLLNWENISNLQDKFPFSPFDSGGFEIKATCGSTPTPSVCKKNGCIKPEIGDQRISLLTGYDWKSHHRHTNNLFGIFWDFIDGKPCIAAVFYQNNLSPKEWGKVVKPKKNGGRTTSVSMMNRQGIRKMYDNWILVIDSESYSSFFSKYNSKS